MPARPERAAAFLALHQSPELFIMPNPWDAGSAKLLASMSFPALATTSSGFAATLGRVDGSVTRDEAIAHGAHIADAVDVPVSADLENCFADDPEGVATTVRLAIEAGLAGGSVEDFTGDRSNAFYDAGLAAERVAAAAEAAHGGSTHFVLTARAEGLLHGVGDLDDIIARLVSYQEAGADVLFAPGLVDLGQIREVLTAVDRPLNVLVLRGAATIAELADAGVRRISVGGAFAFVALAGVIDAARELLDSGTTTYVEKVIAARQQVVAAFKA